ncbi:HpcH/HpaI aldolase/citrate lyase family protein [Hydrocarboniphaga sp.]|uniref:HpcH/HpaI aldolase/citrate lyase family protein n=1 Tax=Hydrocarboniphaga sp. TaxID=2033016 RepID=UPI003D0EE0FF
MLFVPADSDKKLAKALGSGADALVLDLEDAVLPERKPLAREMLRSWMAGVADRSRLWVRVNDLASGELLKDLPAVVASRPAGIVLPKIRGPEDVRVVAHYLDALEAAAGVDAGALQMVVVATETPSAVLRFGDLVREPLPRVRALTWGGEDLSAALGAGDPRLPSGAWRPMYEHARNQCLLGAHALGVEAIDTVYVDFRDPEGLATSCRSARYDGFTGRIAIHPDQVPIINAAFTPSADELAFARRVVDAFASGAGAVAIDGKMFDIPHLKAARRQLGIGA